MIFYLSGTGNTAWAARTVGEATGERLIDITKVEEHVVYELQPGERIGFCFPVHGWRPPMFLRNFIRTLSIDNAGGHYCFALCTAGDNIGETIDILKKDLMGRGIVLDSAFSLIMPESYVGLPFMDVDTPANERKKKQVADDELFEYCKYITNREKGVEILTIGRWPKINSRILGGFFTKYLITDKPFRVDAGKCIGCKACAASCPVGNITMTNDRLPQWQHNGSCLTCFACYHHCPKHAIEYGRRTKHKGQYFFNRE